MLRLECLEPRWVLDGLGSDAYDAVSAAWFQKLALIEVPRAAAAASVATPTTANSSAAPVGDKWIVRLTEPATSAAGSVRPVEHLLDTVAADFQVIRGLGLPGQVLVRSFAAAEIARAALAANPHVVAFEPEQVMCGQVLPDDPDFPSMVNLHNVGQFGSTLGADIDAPEAWDMDTGSPSVVVGVIDSGIDVTHPDLYLNIWLNQGEIPAALKSKLIDTDADRRTTFYDLNDSANASLVRDKNGNGYIDAQDLLADPHWSDGLDTDDNGFEDDFFGWNFRAGVDESLAANDPRDVLGHGTHVAGTIGAIGDNGRGVTGINWQSSLMALKFLDDRNQGPTSDAVLAINYAAMMRTEFGENVRVLNSSWGQSGGASPALRTAIEAAGQAGLLLVAAAGNGNILGQGIDIDREPFYPASYDLNAILSVAATGPADELARFSNYGVASVDLAAPGIGVLSTLPGGRYGTANGTSMAAPHVTGMVALVWSEIPDATLDEVRRAILGSVEPLSVLQTRTVTGGRLNAKGALDSDAFAPRAALLSAPDITTAGGTENLITVRYADRHGIDVATLGDADLAVFPQWGPKGALSVSLVPGTVVVSPDGKEATASYQLVAPGGTWDALDYGRYVVSVAPQQVQNVVGLFAAAADLGQFSVRIPDPQVFYVDSLEDAADAMVGDGIGAAADGSHTLRAAIQEANAAGSAGRTIVLDPGLYALTIPGVADASVSFPTAALGCSPPGLSPPWSNETTGDLDVLGDVTIVGDDPNTTIIHGAGVDRVLKVHPGARLVLRRTSIRGGVAPAGQDGGGILTAGTVQLENTLVTGNFSTGAGGGVAVWGGETHVSRSTISENTAYGNGGGGLFVCNQASVDVLYSTLAGNHAAQGGGAVFSYFGGPVVVGNSTLSGNDAGNADGGAIAVLPSAGHGESASVALSGDGRFVAFDSDASNLIPGDTNGVSDVFVYDRNDQSVERVSVSAAGSEGYQASESPALSANGRYVAFASQAANLVPGDRAGSRDVFVYDRDEKSIERVSVAAGGGEVVGDSDAPALSADGRFVAFESWAWELVPGDTNQTWDVFLYDRDGQSIERVSVAPNGAAGNGESRRPRLSADGRYVAFESLASDLVAGDTNGFWDVFVYDRQTGKIERVSVGQAGAQANDWSQNASLSGDGRYVAFESWASNLVAGDQNATLDVFVRDRQTHSTRRVSVAAGGTEGNGPSSYPSLSADGRFVAYHSNASNLVSGDNNQTWDVFVYRLSTQGVQRLSVAADGTEADDWSNFPVLSSDGGLAAFISRATNLAPGHGGVFKTVFVSDRQSQAIEAVPNPNAEAVHLESVTLAANIGAKTVSGSIVTHNSLFVRNEGRQTGHLDLSRGTVSLGFNLASSSGYGVELMSSDTVSYEISGCVGALADNGGPTWTHALYPDCPAIDGGDPDAFPPSDQRGIARPQDGGDVLGPRPDIGAVEESAAGIFGTVFADLDGDGIRDSNEEGLAGQSVYVDTNKNGAYDAGEPTATSRADNPLTPSLVEQGWFLFAVLSGTYWIAPVPAPGWSRTSSGPQRVSVTAEGSEGINQSQHPALSADARFVAFTSHAWNLVAGDENGVRDVFVYDRQEGSVERVSVADDGSEGNGASGGGGDGNDKPDWDRPSLSADGRFVAFASAASNLVSGDTNGSWDVFVYDRRDHTIERISVAHDGSQGNSSSEQPSLSADGRFVAFASLASNLVPGDSNGAWDVFVYDRDNRTLRRVSVAEAEEGNSHSLLPALSADGGVVAFASLASNLVPGDGNNSADIFAYDLRNDGLERVSVASDGKQGNRGSLFSSVSGDGRFVAFGSDADNLVDGDTNLSQDVFVYDRQNRSIERVSVANDGFQGNSHSAYPSLSADGRFVAFASDASNLASGDADGFTDVFIYDRQDQRVERVSLANDGTQGNGQSWLPSLSSDGRFVAFASEASNLVPGDTNGKWDAFVRHNSKAAGAESRQLTLYAGDFFGNVDFGLAPNPGQIRGICFQDIIANGVRDTGEPGRANCTVYLDANGNGQLDGDERSVVTDADGNYAFTGLPAEREYQIRLVLPGDQALVSPSALENGTWKVFLPAGGLVTDRDFGLTPAPASGQFENAVISGRVFSDRDGNGRLDSGESGLSEITLFLDLNDDGVRQFNEARTVSAGDDPQTPTLDESGQYRFENLGNRPYAVRIQDAVPDFQQTAPLGNEFVKQAFSLAVPGSALGNPQDAAIADLNGDAAPDLAVAVYDRNSVALLLSDGTGRLEPAVVEISLAPTSRPASEPRGFGPIAILAADFNSSGGTDLAVVNNSSSNVAILLDFAGTGFSSEAYASVGILPNAVAAGDMDGDGDLDLLVTNESDNSVSILRNDGLGHFVADALAPAVGNHPFDVATGDFNSDGRLDLAVADFGTYPQGGDLGDLRVLLAGADGLGDSQIACPVGFGPASVVARDLDGDTQLDLAVANLLSDNVTVCRGGGDGTFTTAYTLPGGSGPMDIDAADLDDDGDLDLLLTNGKSQTVGILRNRLSQGAFEFEPAENFGVANFPGASQISLATGDLDGNQTIDLVLANSAENTVAVHFSTLEPGAHRLALTGTETVSGLDFGLMPLDTTLKVASLTATRTGFVSQFNRDLTASVLNLYDQGGVLGPADVTLSGATVGPVRGSLVLDPDLRTITFIKTGGPLEADTYTVTLVSGANAFRDADGNLLDGNGDGTAGDNYASTFVVPSAPAGSVTVSLPDFARGYGQPVNLPADVLTAGMPLQMSDGSGVSRLQFTLRYDPSLLEVQAFTLGSSLVERGAAAQFQVVSPGTAMLDITAAGGLAATSGPLTVGTFTAAVPATAAYGGKHVLDITGLHVFDTAGVPAELPAVDDDAVHVAAFFGDNNGSRSYNAPDVTLNQRLIGLINTGFSAYQLADPLLLADITRNGQMQANDTVSIQRVIGQVPVANLPALPAGLAPPAPSGADPTIYIPQDLAGSPGETVTVPVKILVTEPAGIALSGFDLVLEFDPGRLTAGDAQLGALLAEAGFQGLLTSPAPGVLIYTGSSAAGTGVLPQGSGGALVNVDLVLAAGADAGSTRLNLRASFQTTVTAAFDNGLNALVLIPAPTDAADDSVDGLLTVQGSPSDRLPAQNPDQPLDVNDDGEVTPADVLTVINYLNGGLPQDAAVWHVLPGRPAIYADVNGDRRITAQDVLALINQLNIRMAAAGEGEARQAVLSALLDDKEGESLWELLAEDRLRPQPT